MEDKFPIKKKLARKNVFVSFEFTNFCFFHSIFMRAKSLKDEQPRVVFNSNKIRHDSVIGHEYSPNGKFCALTMSDKNQISIEIMIIDVETAEMHGKCLQLFSFERIAWGANSDGFFIYVNIYVECLYTDATDIVLCTLNFA